MITFDGGIPGLRLRAPDGPWPIILDGSVTELEARQASDIYVAAIGASARLTVAWAGALSRSDAALLEAGLHSLGFDRVLLTVDVEDPGADLRAILLDPVIARFPHRLIRCRGPSPHEGGLRSFVAEVRRRLEELADALLRAGNLDPEQRPLQAVIERFTRLDEIQSAFGNYVQFRFLGATPKDAAALVEEVLATLRGRELEPAQAVGLYLLAVGVAVPEEFVDAREALREQGLVAPEGHLRGWAAALGRPGVATRERTTGGFPTPAQWSGLTYVQRQAVERLGAAGPPLLKLDQLWWDRGFTAKVFASLDRGQFAEAEALLGPFVADQVALTPREVVDRMALDRLWILTATLHYAAGRDVLAEGAVAKLVDGAAGGTEHLAAAFWALHRHSGPDLAWRLFRGVAPKLANWAVVSWDGFPLLARRPEDEVERESLCRLGDWLAERTSGLTARDRRIVGRQILRVAITVPELRPWAAERLRGLREHERALGTRMQLTLFEAALQAIEEPDVDPHVLAARLREALPPFPSNDGALLAAVSVLDGAAQPAAARRLITAWAEAFPTLPESRRLRHLRSDLDRRLALVKGGA